MEYCCKQNRTFCFTLSTEWTIAVSCCPAFGQDNANFHQEPGGDTVGWADPNWPNRTGYSVPCAVMLGSRERKLGRGGGGKQLRLGSMWGIGWWELLSAFRYLFYIFFLSVLLLLLFVSFTVLLNCPYFDPRVFAFFFPFSSPLLQGVRGDRVAVWPFGAGHSLNGTLDNGTSKKNNLPAFLKERLAFTLSEHTWGKISINK